MDEPSVLDLVKAKLAFWRRDPPGIPSLREAFGSQRWPSTGEATPDTSIEAGTPGQADAHGGGEVATPARSVSWPWRAALPFALALTAQICLEPPGRSVVAGVVLYLLAAAAAVWALRAGKLVPPHPPAAEAEPPADPPHWPTVGVGLALVVVAFALFADNRFNVVNTTLWLAGVAVVVRGCWQRSGGRGTWPSRIAGLLHEQRWQIVLTRAGVALLAALLVAAAFRTHDLTEVPADMISDHAELLLDVTDVLDGAHSVFFPRNGGREGMHIYLAAAATRIAGGAPSFLSLKLPAAAAGVLTILFVYLLGAEVANRRAGLFAAALTAVAYWPNVLSRAAMPASLSPLFAAATLAFLFRGLRTGRRNPLLLSGVALGLGFHTYSIARVTPIAVATAVAVFVVVSGARNRRRQILVDVGLLALVAAALFAPLARVALSDPQLFFLRALTRGGTLERAYPGPLLGILAGNVWRGITMFAWSNGETWLHSVPLRPALDVVAGALLHLGAVVAAVRLYMHRTWQDAALLLTIPVLMAPSVAALAFPAEHPSLERSALAMVPVFVVAGLALETLYANIRARLVEARFKGVAAAVALLLLLWSSLASSTLVLGAWHESYRLSTWNASEMGAVIHAFATTVGTSETGWVVVYPHWVDTRLVAIAAAETGRNLALATPALADTTALPGAKLFLVKPEDHRSRTRLENLYPHGSTALYHSSVEGKDFVMFFVPPENDRAGDAP